MKNTNTTTSRKGGIIFFIVFFVAVVGYRFYDSILEQGDILGFVIRTAFLLGLFCCAALFRSRSRFVSLGAFIVLLFLAGVFLVRKLLFGETSVRIDYYFVVYLLIYTVAYIYNKKRVRTAANGSTSKQSVSESVRPIERDD
jgi:hypothetical protein